MPDAVEQQFRMTSLKMWKDAVLAAAIFCVDPAMLGGVIVRALPGPVRTQWITVLRELVPSTMPYRLVPLHVSDGRLLGGLDLAATLSSGQPIAERGLLAEVDGGILELAMAERIPSSTMARLTTSFDAREVVLERDGLAMRIPTSFGMVALDESVAEDEGVIDALRDRVAILLDLHQIHYQDAVICDYDRDDIEAARSRLKNLRLSEEHTRSLCGAALALGIPSLRAAMFACRVALVSAALAGREEVAEEDMVVAARLVLGPRATRMPMPEQEEDNPPPEPPPPDPEQQNEEDRPADQQEPQELEDQILDAAKATMPAGVLAQLQMGKTRQRARSVGKAGAMQNAPNRGRPIGTIRGEIRSGKRLHVVETLRAAAPWQRIRRMEREQSGKPVKKVEIRQDDFRLMRFKHKSETTTIFMVDASGSLALHRLAEAKGAVELLLSDCYVRRDQVSLIAFRGQGAEVLLPPTRSLVRAKRVLASLPGGGGTPLASGVDMGLMMADSIRRRGGTPVLILMTDGRANVARDGTGGRARANEEALSAVRAVRAQDITSLLIDTSPRPQPQGRELALEMGAVYLPLPRADANILNQAVRATTGS